MLIGIVPGTCGPRRAQHARASVYTVPIAPSNRHCSGGFPLLVGQSYEQDHTAVLFICRCS